jgi:DNA polymerase elongation subunit (family B)
MNERKRLYIDIEVSPNIGVFWQTGHKVSIGYENIVQERAIICACWKWEGQSKIYSATWDNNKSDKELVKTLAKICGSATEIIAHNGARFDLPWIRTRALFHRVKFPHSLPIVDTLKVSRGQFKFNSNRLDYISKFTGGHGKLKTEFQWWLDITLKGNKRAMRDMVTYCKKDVLELERVHKVMQPYLKPVTRVSQDRTDCPECGSDHVHLQDRRMTVSAGVKVVLRCQSCGTSWSVPESTYNKMKNENRTKTARR